MPPSQTVGPIEILLVEDNPGDVRLIQEALRESTRPNTTHVVRDGVEAMAFLRREGQYADAVRPDLVLLDLSLPRKDGREVLAELKEDPDLRCIPVVILTASRDHRDVLNAYGLHANGYVTKPMDLDQFMTVFECMGRFWFDIVKLPSERTR